MTTSKSPWGAYLALPRCLLKNQLAPREDQEMLVAIIDAFVKKYRFEEVAQSQRKTPMNTYTAVVHKEDNLYVAECPEKGTASQGETFEEEVMNLKEATELYLEEFPVKQTFRPILTTFEIAAHALVVEDNRRSGH